MIFPDEKMIERKAKEYVTSGLHGWGFEDKNDCAESELSFDSCLAGWKDCINHIKSAASEGFEAWAQDYFSFDGSPVLQVSEHFTNCYQAAVISTAAKYEEKLREKDGRIAAIEKRMIDASKDYLRQLDEKDAEIERLSGLASLHHSREYQYKKELEALRLENKELRDTLKACDEFLSRTPMVSPGHLAILVKLISNKNKAVIQKLTAKEGEK